MYLNIDKHFACLLEDLCIDNVSRDYLIRRLNAEGVKFLTVTLPGLWKSVLISTERGYFDYKETTSFARKGKLPLVFNGLFRELFDAKGLLLAVPSDRAFLVIRQVCEYWYKCAFTFSDEQLDGVVDSFLSLEDDMRKSDDSISWPFVDQCRKSFETYYKPLVNTKLEHMFKSHRPRNGPGSVHVLNKDEHTLPELKSLPGSVVGTCRKDQQPFVGFFKSYESSPEEVKLVSEWNLSEVVCVPKDSRGPRLISKEPLFLLKAQMSFLDWSTDEIEKVTNYRINFKNQDINRQLALKGSIDGSLSTADLKEASDRNRQRVALAIYWNSPIISYFLRRGRSTHTLIKYSNGIRKTIRLSKVAGMGSGLTFPLLALTIHVAVCTMISKRTGIPYKDVMSLVYVYGDDLIVPTMYYHYVNDALELVGLKLNENKSFSKGPFRESCGGDYLNGKEVVPLRLKLTSSKLPTTKTVDKFRLVVKYNKRLTTAYRVQYVDRVTSTLKLVRTNKARKISCVEVSKRVKVLVPYSTWTRIKQIVALPKRNFRLNLSSPLSVTSLERHARLCVSRGLFQVSESIYTYLERILGRLPIVGGSVNYLGRYSKNTFEVLSQDVPKVVFATQAVKGSISEPCPYRYLGTKLRPEKVEVPSHSKLQRLEIADMLHDFRLTKNERNLDFVDRIAPPGLVLGQYNERYALNVVPKRDVEAWHLTNALT